MQCSRPASEDVPIGHMEQVVMFGFLKVPGMQEQLFDPTGEVENGEQGAQADIWESLYVFSGDKLQDLLSLSFQFHSDPEGQLHAVPLFIASEPVGHSWHRRDPSELINP